MIERRPLPALAITAHRLAATEFQRTIDDLGRQTVAAMGFDGNDGAYRVDFAQGLLFREVPDPAPVIAPVIAAVIDSEGAEA